MVLKAGANLIGVQGLIMEVARLERSTYNQVPTRSYHPHAQRPPKGAMESNTPMKTESAKRGHNHVKRPRKSM
jgi:hypothetical protein